MVRKTVAIRDELYKNIELNVLKEYNSFSELVSNALELLIEKQKRDRYKQAMIEASQDKMYLNDLKEIEKDFEFADLNPTVGRE